jgi:hypothetical protein
MYAASLAKTAFAYTVLQPADEGRIDLDASIASRARPWFAASCLTSKDASGPMWFKGGHDDGTGNMLVCQEARRRCVVFLSNSVRAERIYPALACIVLGETAMPWWWEYR